MRRVTRVTSGGKRFRFRCTIVIGDEKGRVAIGVAKGVDVQQADPPPFDAGVEDVSPFDNWADPVPPDAAEAVLDMDRFHDTAPRRALRTSDLPLFQPPQVKMEASREFGSVLFMV